MIPPFCPSQVVGVAQAINKKCGEDGAFTDQDEKVCKGHRLTHWDPHFEVSVWVQKRKKKSLAGNVAFE